MTTVKVLALLTLLKISGLSATNCTLPTTIDGSGNSAVCAGDQVTFTCRASRNITTQERWSSSSWGASGQAIITIRDRPGNIITRPVASGNFNVSLVSTKDNVLVTEVVVNAVTVAQNGTTVMCEETPDGATFMDVGTGCIVFAAPPSEPVATPTYCTLDSVTLQWNGSLYDGGSNLTNYTLTSSPPTSNCNGSCAVGPTTRQYTFSGLLPEVPYTLGVRGANCGGTLQGAPSTVNVTIPSPQSPTVCPVFDADTRQLIQLSSTWYPLRINGSLLCGPVDAYNISYAGSDSTDVYSIPAANCSSNCRHLFPVGTRNSPQYNVSVAGFGVLGTIKTIVSTNNILKVDVVNWPHPGTINCTFLPGLVGTSGCVVSFGTSPDYLPYTSTSSQRGGSGQSVSVQLTINGVPLDPNTSYFYTASLQSANTTNECVTVKGSFCALGYLRCQGTPLSNNCSCPVGYVGMEMTGGCVCYNGITPGSQASVTCYTGFQLQGVNALQCLGNGLWNNVRPFCSKINSGAAGRNDLPAGKIAGAVVGSVLGFSIIVIVAVIAASICIKKKSNAPKTTTDGMERSTELTSSIAYPVSSMPLQPPPAGKATNNDKEWASIMRVVTDAAGPAQGGTKI